MPLVFEELRGLARHTLKQERPDHTQQSPASVHEAYLRPLGQNPPEWRSRTHFFGVAAKRGGSSLKFTLNDDLVGRKAKDLDLLALDDPLTRLAQLSPQPCHIAELGFFSGLTMEDTSEVSGISRASVERNWTTARAWLFRGMIQSEQT